jgi:hypothetical protein
MAAFIAVETFIVEPDVLTLAAPQAGALESGQI